jgi:uncharacterized protein YbjT (DUF2867 family)
MSTSRRTFLAASSWAALGRIAKGGEVLAPGNPTDPVQIIDARDLAEFTVRACENRVRGVYNCTGPQSWKRALS